MSYRNVNLAVETYSLIICAVLLVYQIIERRAKNKTNKWFTNMIVFNMLMLLGDMGDWGLGGVPGKWSFYLQNIFTIIVYFGSSGMLLFSLFGWVHSNIQQKKRVPPAYMKVAVTLAVTQVVLALTAPIHKMCYIDAENYYQRGKLFFLTQLCPYVVYIMAIYLLIRYRKVFKPREFAYMILFVSIPFLGELIQVLTYELTTLNLSVTVCLILIFTFIQSQKELDSEKTIQKLIRNENKKLEEMQSFQENLSGQLIDVLCGTVEAKDIYTKGHSLRVAQYAREIMYRMGGDERQQQEVYYIGLLHDVGKISIKDEIINKKGRLTEEEYEQVKMHTIAGYQILREVDVIPDLAIGARWHHERYDGTGYPNGLSGENIPLIARIISVADAYDAMTSNRTYHKTMPQSVVRDQIAKGMGSQFDPKIARIMLDMIDEDLQYEMRQVDFDRIIDILLVDDDPMIHKVVQHALIDENYVLTSAYSGKEGIACLKEGKYDLCLLDMEMPEMNGFEVMEWIQQNFHRLRVIFLTGEKNFSSIKKSEELGARDYITKPINPNILKVAISSVIKR